MSHLHSIISAAAEDGIALIHPRECRGDELHCELAPGDVVPFWELVCGRLGAEFVMTAGEDRRADGDAFLVHHLFAHPQGRWLVHASMRLDPRQPELRSVARFHYPASRFEREMADLFGIHVSAHPDPSPLVRHGFWPEDYYPLRTDATPRAFADDGQPFPFTQVGGEGVYEIPVGPVHAGVIEPGHFRFSVVGETIIHMRSRLYFTHKGTEKLFEGRLPEAGVELAERVSGDTSVGHALAYCQAVEAAAGVDVPRRARYLRVLLLELERLYNHIADFGAIANDTGFAVAHAHCYRIRESLLRLNKQVTGSRLLRGGVTPGGVLMDLDGPVMASEAVARAVADFEEVVEICVGNTLLMDRLEGTGILGRDAAVEHGVLGVVARASGLDADVRRDRPFAAYDELTFTVPVHASGDVKARALVRVEEVRQSAALIHQVCEGLPAGPLRVPLGRIEPFQPAFGMVEGWRGRIVHWLLGGADGRLRRVKIVDPSFLNWPALAVALADTIVPDFPLCNKSFNLSYSGNDL
jgi:Ni,Fe-hydrogenase III large subunit/Ni,Fe-hydrogenase III component G